MRIELEVDSTAGEARIVSLLKDQSAKAAAAFVPVYVNGHQFTTQAELDDYLRRVQERDANLAEWDKAFAEKGEALEAGQLDCRNFNTDDAYFFWRFGAELTAYVGPRAPESRLINALDVGALPDPEFPQIGYVDQAQLRGGWDWTQYRGPLRAILAGHRGVTDI